MCGCLWVVICMWVQMSPEVRSVGFPHSIVARNCTPVLQYSNKWFKCTTIPTQFSIFWFFCIFFLSIVILQWLSGICFCENLCNQGLCSTKKQNSNYTCVWTVNSIRCIWIKQILSRCMVSWCLWYGSAGMDFTHKSKQISKQTYKENTRELPRKFMIIFCYFSKYRYAYITP